RAPADTALSAAAWGARMTLAPTRVALATLALVTACNQGGGNEPKNAAAKPAPAAHASSSPASAQIYGHGFGLLEGDDTAVPMPALMRDVVAAGANTAQPNWHGTDDWADFLKAPQGSRWRITVLNADQSPAVGATVAVKKLQMAGTQGYVALDSIVVTSTR